LSISRQSAPTEHVFPQNLVARRRLAATVESLFSSVVNARNAGGRQVNGKRIEYEFAIFNRSTKAVLLASLGYLVVVVKHRDHLLTEPGEIAVVVQFRIPKESEVFVKVPQSL
jgi:hypothetical protein